MGLFSREKNLQLSGDIVQMFHPQKLGLFSVHFHCLMILNLHSYKNIQEIHLKK